MYLFEAWSGSGVVFRGLDLGLRPFESFLSFEVVRGDTAGLHGGVGRSEKIEDPWERRVEDECDDLIGGGELE